MLRDLPELWPWELAPVTGYCQLLNVFGNPTGEKVFVERGARDGRFESHSRLAPRPLLNLAQMAFH